jgi:integrase
MSKPKPSKKSEKRTRTNRPLGGWIGRVKMGGEYLDGLFGRTTGADGKAEQKRLTHDAEDMTGAEVALARWQVEILESAPEVERDPEALRKLAARLLTLPNLDKHAKELDDVAKRATTLAGQAPAAPGEVRSLTTAEFLPEFLKVTKPRVGAAHFADLECRCEKFADYAGNRPMAAIDGVVVGDYLAKLADAAGHRFKVPVLDKDGKPVLDKKGKPLGKVVRNKMSHHAVRRHRAALSILWKCAIDRNVVAANIWTGNAAKISSKTEKGKEFVPVNLTTAEVDRILIHVEEPIRPILVFLAETGLRLSEARTLTWQNVEPKQVAFKVTNTKTGTDRRLPTTERARAVLDARWKAHVSKTRGTDLVFADFSRNYIYVCFKDAVKAAGVKWGARIHDLRHYAGSRLAEHTQIQVVMQALGHSRLQTVQRYVHPAEDALVNAFRAVEAARDAESAVKAG